MPITYFPIYKITLFNSIFLPSSFNKECICIIKELITVLNPDTDSITKYKYQKQEQN